MGFFSRFFKKSNSEVNEMTQAIPVVMSVPLEHTQEEYIPLELPEGEIVTFDGEVLDVTNPENIQKFKHNLEILIEQTRRNGRVENFALVREDDFLPRDWIWQASSKNTDLEKVCLRLSYEVKCIYALEKAGVKHTVNGFSLPIADSVLNDAFKGIPKDTGFIYMPVHFRSTKHFTVNTPLSVTGDYNGVRDDRNFIVIDNPRAFLDSGYSYSIAYHDAYLDVTHEGLPVSPDAVVLIQKSKYEKLKNNPDIVEQLKQRKVIIFEGDEAVAINMVLTEMGVLPSQMGDLYAHYDQELRDIIEQSMRELASSRSLLYDKSHAGENGHFTSKYDDINREYDRAYYDIVEFLKRKFPEHADLFSLSTINSESSIVEMIRIVGPNELLNAINEYNMEYERSFMERYRNYRKEREAITPEVHNIFVATVRMIDEYYMSSQSMEESIEDRNMIESLIQHFFQDGSVREQLDAAIKIMEFMKRKENVYEEETTLKM